MKRRDFLMAGVTGTAGFALSGLTALTPRKAAAATTVNVTLAAE